MSDEFQTPTQTGVETPGAAVQTEPTQTPVNPTEPYQTGVEPSAADSQRVEQAFAKRLASERQKIEQEYSPYRGFIESEAKRYNMTTEQYIQAVEQQRQAEERQQYIDQGINPDLVNQLLEKHPDIQYAREMRSKQQQEVQFQAEANEFFQTFPDVDASKIDPEVFRLKAEKGLSLTDAYLRVNFSKMRSQTEQEVIAKLQSNAQSSPGALGQGGEPPANSISKMSKSDFEKLQQEVLRGERKNL